MNKITLPLAGLLFSTVLIAQDTTRVEGPWKYKGMASLNFAQVSSRLINGLA